MDLLPLKTVTREKVYQDNLIIGRQRDGRFSVDGKVCRFMFTHRRNSYKAGCFFKAKVSDHYLWVSLEKLPPVSYFSEEFRDIDLDLLPDEIRPVVLESASEHVIEAIEEELGIALSLEEFRTEVPEDEFDQELAFLVNMNGGQEVIRGRMHMDSPAFEFIAALLERSNYVRKHRFMSVEASLYVILGMETFSLREFKGLEAGDIIVLNNQGFFEEGHCRVVVGGKLVYSGIFQNGEVILGAFMDEKIENENLPEETEEHLGNESMEDLDLPRMKTDIEEEAYDEEDELLEAEDEGEIPEGMGEIPINIVFEVGQKRIALAELQTLKSGYTFELENPADMPVTIRANGKVIGKGELLKIGEHVGVRVASFK